MNKIYLKMQNLYPETFEWNFSSHEEVKRYIKKEYPTIFELIRKKEINFLKYETGCYEKKEFIINNNTKFFYNFYTNKLEISLKSMFDKYYWSEWYDDFYEMSFLDKIRLKYIKLKDTYL